MTSQKELVIELINRLMAAKGATETKVGERLGVSQNAINKIRNRKNGASEDVRAALAVAFPEHAGALAKVKAPATPTETHSSWEPIGSVPEFAEAMRKAGPPPPVPEAGTDKPEKDPADVFGAGEFLACVFLPPIAIVIGVIRGVQGKQSGPPMIVVPVFVMAVAAGLYLTNGGSALAAPAAEVRCRAAGLELADGFRCEVAHQRGPAARVCWTVVAKCRNMRGVTPKKCVSIQPGATDVHRVAVGPGDGDPRACDLVDTIQIGETTAQRL